MPRVLPALFAALLTCTLHAAAPMPTSNSTPPPPAAHVAGPAAELSATDAVILGVIEGLTEFLPVSSTGHLVLAKDLLHLTSNEPMFDAMNEPLWYRRASSDHGAQLLTLNLAADTFIVVIQFGAIAAVALVCWPQLKSMVLGALGRDPAGRRLLVNVMIAFVPAALIGWTLHDWVDENLFSVKSVVAAQVAGALLMFYVEGWYGRRYLQGIVPDKQELTPAAAAGIGLLQCVAIWPGTSRPMMAIVGGYFAGLDPRRAAEFSFVLGFVTLSAATAYKTYSSGAAMIQVFGWPHVLLGAGVAAVVAFASVRFLVHLLLRRGLNYFAWYRLILAGAILLYYS